MEECDAVKKPGKVALVAKLTSTPGTRLAASVALGGSSLAAPCFAREFGVPCPALGISDRTFDEIVDQRVANI